MRVVFYFPRKFPKFLVASKTLEAVRSGQPDASFHLIVRFKYVIVIKLLKIPLVHTQNESMAAGTVFAISYEACHTAPLHISLFTFSSVRFD